MIEDIEDIQNNSGSGSLEDFTEGLTNLYIHQTSTGYRRMRGQFFTPKRISKFMIKQFDDIEQKKKLRILDPGAGIGIFESSFCDYIKLQRRNVKKIFFDLYENDTKLMPFLNLNMDFCREKMKDAGFDVSYKIFSKDFILSNYSIFNNENDNFSLKKDGYDFIISNPPYYKLQKNSSYKIAMKSIIRGQSNIYVLFIALSAKLLKNDGQITVLTPRSYCSGLYFRDFRKWFFKHVRPTKIHIFESRRVFKKFDVLQEMIILTAIKRSNVPKKIVVSFNNGEYENNDIQLREIDYKNIILKNGDDILIRMPISELDEYIADQIDKFEFKLKDFGIKVSTGPVVPFRAEEYLLDNICDVKNVFPLIRIQNLRDGKIEWPIPLNKKPIAIKNKKGSSKLLIDSGNYVLVKRFSTKEGKRRINASVLLETCLNSDYVGIENHVNYIYRIDGNLTENEAYGIAALLNSRLYNRYFQMSNGSTQVNASEISNIPLPSLEKIRLIGSLVKKTKNNDEIKTEKIIAKELNIRKNILVRLIK